MKTRKTTTKATKKPTRRTARPAAKTSASNGRAAKRASSAGKRPAAAPKVKRGAATQAAKSAKKSARPMGKRRDDYGAPIDGFFAKQPAHLRKILETLRGLVEKTVPDATAALKWGMPMYTIGRAMVCGLGGHKAHVNLILAGPKGTFADPQKRLTGEGKTGQHLTLRTIDELPRDAVQKWLRAAADVARAKA